MIESAAIVLVALVLMSAYLSVLLRLTREQWLGFGAIVAVSFVFLFVALFQWHRDMTTGARLRFLGLAALHAALTSAALTAIFQYVFLVHLP